MDKILRIVTGLAGLLFLLAGVSWLFDPAGAAQKLGMPLLEGLGRSSQIADCGAFFSVGGIMILSGVITKKRSWFTAPILMLFSAALFRILAWTLQGATFAAPMIAVELVLTALLIFTASRMESSN